MTETEIRDALDRLPLTVEYRDEHYSGDGTAVAGTATDGSATVQFEIVSGKPEIENPLFPQGNIGLEAQRGVGNGYTVTISLPANRAASRREAPLANDIEGAVCELADNCGV